MPIITSPVKKFPGTVEIYNQLTLPQVELIEECFDNLPSMKEGGVVALTSLDKPRLAAILACVKEWKLENYPVPTSMETFTLSPRRATHQLIDYIFNHILLVYNGEIDIPNESSPTPS